MSIFSHHSRHCGKHRAELRAFTLIELLAVSAIIVIITLALLLRQSKFDSSTLLRSLDYSVALSVRQAQVYGTSVFGATGGTVFASGYGLYFNVSSPGSYILFADLNSNGKYDSGEDVQVFTLNKGYTVSEFCAITAVAKRCDGADDTGGGAGTISSMMMFFKRPNPDAAFVALNGAGAPIAGDVYNTAYVQVRSNDGTTRSILVYTTGQIVVQPPGTLP